MIIAFNSNFTELNEKIVIENRHFLKGIHLKNEIGVFVYFIQNIQKVSIILYNSNTFSSLFEDISLDKVNFTFEKDYVRNDIDKLNNNKIYYISISAEKEHFQFIGLT